MSIRRTKRVSAELKEKLDEVVLRGETPKLYMDLVNAGHAPPNYSWYKLRTVINTGNAHAFEINMLEKWFGLVEDIEANG